MSELAPRRLRQLGELSVDQLRHVGQRRVTALRELDVESILDLLGYYPRRYVDRTRRVDVSELTIGDEAAVYGTVATVRARRTRQGRSMVEATIEDGAESLDVVFFNQAWRSRQLVAGAQVLLYGRVVEYRGRRQLTNPVVDVVVGASGDERDAGRVGRIVPIYPALGKAGLTSWELGGFVEESLRRAGPLLDPMPDWVLAECDLVSRTQAYWAIHRPAALEDAERARRRLAFDELVRLQLLLALRRRRLERESSGLVQRADVRDLDVGPGEVGGSLLRQFLAGHRFQLTGAQRRVLGDILADMASPVPMHRLLQGDVGSGKTVVALAAMMITVDHHRQAALMAPTEVLAEQHLASIRADLAGLRVADEAVLGGSRPLNVQLLSGRLRVAQRRSVLEQVARGEVDVVVGTHALLSEDVTFRELGLAVVDEQHRFGVEQRALLRAKGAEWSQLGAEPDLLVMTATPIPRTAAMVLFGDLEHSVLDELPPGRVPVTTSWAQTPAEEARGWQRVRDEVALGHRAYVICPLVEESERVAAAGAVEEHARLSAGALAGLRVGLVHGQMASAAKEAVMQAFRTGELDVLVATVVIEVGVDVADATVIVIEDAWRFGLAQLHQLRGRVGRSDLVSFCYVFGAPPADDGRQRLEAFVGCDDGFALAEIDLALRGEGTILGVRQRGRSDLRLASLTRDADVLAMAHDVAGRLVEADLRDQAALVDELRLFVGDEEAGYLFKS